MTQATQITFVCDRCGMTDGLVCPRSPALTPGDFVASTAIVVYCGVLQNDFYEPDGPRFDLCDSCAEILKKRIDSLYSEMTEHRRFREAPSEGVTDSGKDNHGSICG